MIKRALNYICMFLGFAKRSSWLNEFCERSPPQLQRLPPWMASARGGARLPAAAEHFPSFPLLET